MWNLTERTDVVDSRKPIVAITMGDPAGIGPEIIVRAQANAAVHRACRPVILGDPQTLKRAVRLCRLPMEVQEVSSPGKIKPSPKKLTVINCWENDSPSMTPGGPTQISGLMAVKFIQAAAKLALAKQVSAITTAPISKAAIAAAGFPYPGHTELLATLTHSKEVAMLMIAPFHKSSVKILLVSTHLPLKHASTYLTIPRIVTAIRLAHRSAQIHFGRRRPKIAVAALNPHAGEAGTLGMEEQLIIQPAITKTKKSGLNVYGPFPADSLMVRMVRGEFDIAVAMYHDQALIPVKLLSFGQAVNFTVGIPFIRTSVDHGTAYDIAWKGKADPGSLVSAITTAARLSRSRY